MSLKRHQEDLGQRCDTTKTVVPTQGGSCVAASYNTNAQFAEYSTILIKTGTFEPFCVFTISLKTINSDSWNGKEHNVIVHTWVALRQDQL